MIDKKFIFLFVFVFSSCDMHDRGGEVLIDGVLSRSSYELNDGKYEFYDKSSVQLTRTNIVTGATEKNIATDAYTNHKFHQDFSGKVLMSFLNNELMEILFYPDKFNPFVETHFPELLKVDFHERITKGKVYYWKAEDAGLKQKYVGIADAYLWKKYMSLQSE